MYPQCCRQPPAPVQVSLLRAGDGIRTHDNDVGNVVLYQLSYTRADASPSALLHVGALGAYSPGE